jgi:hypothetical protein
LESVGPLVLRDDAQHLFEGVDLFLDGSRQAEALLRAVVVGGEVGRHGETPREVL